MQETFGDSFALSEAFYLERLEDALQVSALAAVGALVLYGILKGGEAIQGGASAIHRSKKEKEDSLVAA